MKTYIVKQIHGGCHDSFSVDIFITNDKEYAEKYVKKFNRRLSIAKNHINDMEHKQCAGLLNISKKDCLPFWHSTIFSMDECVYKEIETRP